MVFDCVIDDAVESIQWLYPLMEIALWIIPSGERSKMCSELVLWTACVEIDFLLQLARLHRLAQ
jgi:hypothetical protein